MSLSSKLSGFWINCQRELFPWVEETIGPLEGRHKKLLSVLEMVRVERFLPSAQDGIPGRPLKSRAALARAFLAKMVFNMDTTRALVERLRSDPTLRRLCGWHRLEDVPSEATFSRAFREFSEAELPTRVHEALIKDGYSEQLVGHLSRDSTAIAAREKPVLKKESERPECKPASPSKDEERSKKPKRLVGQLAIEMEEELPEVGHPSQDSTAIVAQEDPVPQKKELERPEECKSLHPTKDEKPPKELPRLVRQRTMGTEEMLEELPKRCTVGVKRNAKGHTQKWTGYKLHMDVADGGVPISGFVSSASLHDSQAAIPLATISQLRVRNLYDLMDSAYDAKQIHEHSKGLGHVPIIDHNPRRKGKAALIREKTAQRAAGLVLPEDVRYRERSTVERAFGRLKDEFGGRNVRVRGHKKVTCHLMFGVLVLTVDQLLRMVQ